MARKPSRAAKAAAPAAKKRTTESIAVDELRLDSLNPRLPEDKRGASQQELLAFVAEEYDAHEIAKSIAAHGYFESEPIIAIRENDQWVVVEGNRRLAAIKILNNFDFVEELDLTPENWEDIPDTGLVPSEIPVVVAGSRKEVAPIIGYRHISGIEPWDPWAKARFLAYLVEEEGLSFEATAAEVGERTQDIQAHYRNFQIVRQAETLGVPTGRVVKRFGVFTRTLQDSDVQSYIGAPAPKNVKRGTAPLPAAAKTQLINLFSWVFGDDKHEPVFTDSRRIRDLGRVLSSKEAEEILRRTRNLEEAHAAAGGVRDRLLTRLTKARSNLAAAASDFPEYADDPDVQQILSECAELVEEMVE